MADGGVFDVVVVGGGAAGVAAAARLEAAGVSSLLIEAADRLGGRAHTVTPAPGIAVDLGCSWLHSAEQNDWTKIAPTLGFEIDRSDAAWTRPALDLNFPPDDQLAYRRVFQAFEDRLEQAAEAPEDHPASDLMDPAEARWAPMLNAFSGYYNGAPFDRISVKDYAAYQPTDENWRLPRGYGALVSAYGAGLNAKLSTPVSLIRHGGKRIELVTTSGTIEAHAVIVCVSTTVIAEAGLRLDPPLNDKQAAAHALPLGHVEKAFLKLDPADAFPLDTMVRGQTDTADTGGYTLRPLGLPIVEGFFGGDMAGGLAKESPEALTAFAIEELVAVLGSAFRSRLSPLVQSRWTCDPFIRGAYSHARVGEAGARARLAAPVDGRLFFAGEACSPHAFSTAHGAYETGVSAAEAAIEAMAERRILR